MFTYAFVEGYAAGLLDKRYAQAARKAWIGLCGQLEDYAVKEVCVGTGGKNDRQHYLDRPRKTGDHHGQCAMMWVANALVNHSDF
jgi:rhamnogalacturonyl hydrolase YesR